MQALATSSSKKNTIWVEGNYKKFQKSHYSSLFEGCCFSYLCVLFFSCCIFHCYHRPVMHMGFKAGINV